MANPSITELQNEEKFELLADLNHQQIKSFVVYQLMENGKIVRAFMFYQVVMILFGMFFFIRTVVLAIKHFSQPFFISVAAFFFCFTFLVVIHELLHGFAMKMTGASKIRFGGYFRKFIFYAEADQHVFNRKQFAFVALFPFATVKIVSLLGIILSFSTPWVYSWIILMSTHSLFCAGDIGLLSLFYREKNAEIFTFDVRAEKKSYYFIRKDRFSEN
jgi:hypothetical protein